MRVVTISFMYRNANTQNTIDVIFNRLHEYTWTPLTTFYTHTHIFHPLNSSGFARQSRLPLLIEMHTPTELNTL